MHVPMTDAVHGAGPLCARRSTAADLRQAPPRPCPDCPARNGQASRVRAAARSLLALVVFACLPAHAFTSGSTVCEVNALPFAPMASVLRQPPPSGWTLHADADSWYPGAIRLFRLAHPDPQRRARGILVWVKGSPFGNPAGAGRFLNLGVGDRYQFVNATPPENCAEWALTHRDARAKEQSLLLFAWQAPDMAGWGNLGARAFVIEDCDVVPGTCRDAQALTTFLPLREVLFAAGFE